MRLLLDTHALIWWDRQPDRLSERAQVQQANGFHLLPVTLDHVLALEPLPLHHRDPFDRVLAAQASAEGAVLVTRDPLFDGYPVQTLW